MFMTLFLSTDNFYLPKRSRLLICYSLSLQMLYTMFLVSYCPSTYFELRLSYLSHYVFIIIIIICANASIVGYKPPHEDANFRGSMTLASNRSQPSYSGHPSILLQGVLQYVRFDVVATPKEVCAIGHQLFCRSVWPTATSTCSFSKLCRLVSSLVSFLA